MHNTYVYYYAQLPKRLQRDVYLPILKVLQTHKEKCAVPFITVEEMDLVLDCLVLEQPLISFYQTYRYRTFNGLVFSIEFDYLLNAGKQEIVINEMIDQANKIAAYAHSASGENSIMQVKALYEYFSKCVTYDYELHSFAFNAAGVFLYGNGVCVGISLALKMVLDMLCIPSIVVRGEHDGGAHAWSMLYLADTWIPFDLTVGVCSSTQNCISYDGFGMLPYPEKYQAWDAFPLPQPRKECL